ncbi:MAG: 6,7-dimethyl-8-ribityllumazine synthase [Chloroflexi bacterium]|nr:6,7-dimethyl-8-ribityllumazine synthase [Chloroflexota bacterium]MDA8238483.1 6,7-dimethyl-8-ribityllumazine synthase [Chloroflexota bacterium]
MTGSGVARGAPAGDDPDGRGLRIGIVAARFNAEIVEVLVETARDELRRLGVRSEDVVLLRVPGAFELPIAARALLRSAAPPDAVICLGAVIQGETRHFDFVAGAAADGILRVGLDSGRPVIFGVLTTNTLAQARDRAEGTYRRGADAARDAVAMARLLASPDLAIRRDRGDVHAI